MKKSLYLEWFEKGNNDINSAEVLLRTTNYYENVCFLVQQSIEKYLKGYLTFKNTKFERTHNLIGLLEICIKEDYDFEKFADDCLRISGYYISTRYPIFTKIKFTDELAEYSVKKAKEIIKFILKKTDKNKKGKRVK